MSSNWKDSTVRKRKIAGLQTAIDCTLTDLNDIRDTILIARGAFKRGVTPSANCKELFQDAIASVNDLKNAIKEINY